MGIPTPEKFEQGIAAMFSGSRFMRFMMPPLLGLSALFSFLACLAGFANEEGINWWLAIGGLTWGITLTLAAYASFRPRNTRWIQGIFSLHLSVWLGASTVAMLKGEPQDAGTWIPVIALVIFTVGAASYGVACFRSKAVPDSSTDR